MTWAIIVTFVLLGWVLSLLTHEVSHVVANKLVGRTITAFKPWPHLHNGKFYFGRASSIGPSAGLMWVHASPLIKGALLCPIWVALGLWVYTPFFLFMATDLIDMLWWFKGFVFGPLRTDGSKFRRKL